MLELYPIACYISLPVSISMQRERLLTSIGAPQKTFDERLVRTGTPDNVIERRKQNRICNLITRVPGFSRYCQEASVFGVPSALSHLVADLGMEIDIDNKIRDWNHRKGVLIVVEDHSFAFEGPVILAALHEAGLSKDIKLISWRISPPNDLINALDPQNNLLLEVTPREQALERPVFNRKAETALYPVYRALYHNQLPQTQTECDSLNEYALMAAADELSRGSVVIVFPKGSKFSHQWQPGLARIMAYLPRDDFEKTTIASLSVKREDKKFSLETKEAFVEAVVGNYHGSLTVARELRWFLNHSEELRPFFKDDKEMQDYMQYTRELDKDISQTILEEIRQFCVGDENV
jgi:hypothetical protein